MKKALKIVVDTSIFVNPDSRKFLGKSIHEAFTNFLDNLKESKDISCYIPPSVYEELMKFMEKKIPTEKTILITQKPPSSYESSIPAFLLYEFINDMRLRINKGLRIAEKYTRKALKSSLPEGKDLKEEDVIKSVREEYRVALREGILDSKEDFDLILLAKEIDASLATSDQGLVKWAQKLGIPCLNAKELKEIIAPQS